MELLGECRFGTDLDASNGGYFTNTCDVLALTFFIKAGIRYCVSFATDDGLPAGSITTSLSVVVAEVNLNNPIHSFSSSESTNFNNPLPIISGMLFVSLAMSIKLNIRTLFFDSADKKKERFWSLICNTLLHDDSNPAPYARILNKDIVKYSITGFTFKGSRWFVATFDY